MSLLDVANKECQRLRELKHPYTAPELFPSPAIQSTQVMAALFAVEQALAQFKKQYAKVAAKKTDNSRVAARRHRPKLAKRQLRTMATVVQNSPQL